MEKNKLLALINSICISVDETLHSDPTGHDRVTTKINDLIDYVEEKDLQLIAIRKAAERAVVMFERQLSIKDLMAGFSKLHASVISNEAESVESGRLLVSRDSVTGNISYYVKLSEGINPDFEKK